MSNSTDYALRAIVYTKKELGLLPSNNAIKKIITGSKSTECVSDLRDDFDDVLNKSTIVNIERLARVAISHGCGNCAEYAAVVFDFLKNIAHCPYKIEYAQYIWPGDHAFVIINRNIGSSPALPQTWGSTAVVADAWTGLAVLPRDYYNNMPTPAVSVEIMAHWQELYYGL